MHTVRNALNHPLQLSSSSPNSALNILFSLSKSSSYSSPLDNTDIFLFQFSRSVVSNSLQPPGTAACQASLSVTNSWSLPGRKLMSIESVMPSSHLILCCPLLFPPSIFPIIRVFSNESILHIRWPIRKFELKNFNFYLLKE